MYTPGCGGGGPILTFFAFMPAGVLDDDSDDLPPLVAFDDPVGIPPPRGNLADSGRLDDEAVTLPPLTAGTGIACCALGLAAALAYRITTRATAWSRSRLSARFLACISIFGLLSVAESLARGGREVVSSKQIHPMQHQHNNTVRDL